ncbi:MAG: hypothetical protein SAL07_00955 [Oscillatoria sp. PMC 1051.18]|nr:hypothetical protein [Oscillatoria sp. PMC 1050.18]MEC5028453.1 hypothetical protein [Oscillatoria sp. PMC 1051.18]
MTEKTSRKTPLFPSQPRLSAAEIAQRTAADNAFAQRCREIFWRVYPELVGDYYNWAIIIEPESGEYFVDPDPEVAFQKARQKYPNARILEKRLNETGCVGKI